MDKELKTYLDKKFTQQSRELKATEKRLDKKIDNLNMRTAKHFTPIQTQLSTIQRTLNDADLPQIKRDNKLLKEAIGIKTA